MSKKILALALTLAMVFGLSIVTLLPVSAAVIMQPLDFTDASTPASGDGYSWDSASKTLTLSGIDLNVTTGIQWQPGLKVPIGSTIVAQTGTVNKIHLNANSGYGYSVTAVGSNLSEYITLTGEGSLEVSVTGTWTNCISVTDGSVHIENMPNLVIKADSNSASSGGIATSGAVSIKTSNVTITAGNMCISGSPVVIEDSTVKMTTKHNNTVTANGESLIKNSNVTLEGGTFAWTQGLFDGGVLTIDNSTINAKISTNNYVFYEWKSSGGNGFVFTNGSKITTTGGSKAVHVNSNFITFGDCEFTVDGTVITDYKTNAKFYAAIINVFASYAAVDAEIAKTPADLTVYTSESLQVLNDAIGAVVRGKYDTEQAVVDGYADTIKNALTALVPLAPIVSGTPTAASITLNTIPGAEYSIDNGTTWQDSPTFVELTPNTGYTFIVRIKATANSYASANSPASAEIKTDKSTPSTPNAPIVEGTPTATSITLKTKPGAEYSIDNGATWQDSPTFTGLTPNTGYTFIARIKETPDYYASANSAASAIITTAKDPDNPIKYIFTTKYQSTFWNWVLFIVCFGWIWMWFI